MLATPFIIYDDLLANSTWWVNIRINFYFQHGWIITSSCSLGSSSSSRPQYDLDHVQPVTTVTWPLIWGPLLWTWINSTRTGTDNQLQPLWGDHPFRKFTSCLGMDKKTFDFQRTIIIGVCHPGLSPLSPYVDKMEAGEELLPKFAIWATLDRPEVRKLLLFYFYFFSTWS